MIKLLPYAVAAAVAVGALAWVYVEGRSAGADAARAECHAAQEAARSAHAVEVARIADAASVAAADALAARQSVRSLTDALRRETRPACAVGPADAERVREVIRAARGAQAVTKEDP